MDIQVIKADFDAGMAVAKIAKKHGLNPGQILALTAYRDDIPEKDLEERLLKISQKTPLGAILEIMDP